MAEDERPERDDRRNERPPRRDGRPSSRDGGAQRSDRNDRRSSGRPTSGDRPRQGGRPSYGDRPNRSGDRPSYGDRPNRSGDRPSYGDRPRSGDRPARQGDRPSYGDRPARSGDRPNRSGDRPSYGDRPARSGDRPSYGDRPNRSGGRPSYGDRPRQDDRRGSRPPQGSDDRRAKSLDPALPDDLTARDLPNAARNELKTLSKENAEVVARHLAMAGRLVDEDPALAHEHALAASRRAGRIAIVRETVAITAYATGDFALALRELRTFRRISGRDDQIALMVDSERGVDRPDRALELGRSVDRSSLPVDVRVELAIAMSGAHLDLGDAQRALTELDIPELDPDRAFEWSPGLFAARAAVLEELGRDDEAQQWYRRAEIAGDALDAASGIDGLEVVEVESLVDEPEDDAGVSEPEPEPEPRSESASGDSAASSGELAGFAELEDEK